MQKVNAEERLMGEVMKAEIYGLRLIVVLLKIMMIMSTSRERESSILIT